METQFSEEDLLTFARAMANVAAADGRVTEDERYELENLISGIGLSPSDEKVVAIVNAEFEKPSSLTEIVKGLSSREMKAALLRMLVEVSCADGEIALEERAKVSEAATAFGYEPKIAGELIDWTLESIRLEQREAELMSKLM